MTPAAETLSDDVFAAAVAQFDKVRDFMTSDAAAALEHSELEGYIRTEGFELLRLMLQGHFDRRAASEEPVAEVIDADGVAHRYLEKDHDRDLATIVGTVEVRRFAYRRRASENLYPADAAANLPEGLHSHGLRELAAIEASRGSFEEATEALGRASGVAVAKRQVEGLAKAAALDFAAFYEAAARPLAEDDEVVVISADGKGIAMRPDALRPATAAAAAKAEHKLDGRLSKGEKRNRKRMAELGGVYTVSPVPRTPADVMARSHDEGPPKPAPVAKNKWLTASVVDDAAGVIAAVFDEAERRDPGHERDWVALVDGNNHQIDRIKAEAKARGIDKLTIVVDWVHVLEYIWSAVWSFFSEGDPAAEEWVGEKALAVLEGKAVLVAAAIRRKATTLGLGDSERKNADTCADYLLAKAAFLDYPTALAAGWPIATGIIEGACRHLVRDRMAVTGARWGLEGAETVLKLRALRSNGDWESYWRFHRAQERRRVHESCYLDNVIPSAA
jgi:hypothetical protein